MQKLENIPKKNIYNVPEGYFDKLPEVIQSRVAKEGQNPLVTFSWLTTLKYALPVLLVGIAGLFWYNQTTDQPMDADAILATIETEVLVQYISASELTTDELLDSFSFQPDEVANIENEVYGSLYGEELDVLMEEFDVDLNNF